MEGGRTGELVIPNGVYKGGTVSAPRSGWLVLRAQSPGGVVVDLRHTGLQLERRHEQGRLRRVQVRQRDGAPRRRRGHPLLVLRLQLPRRGVVAAVHGRRRPAPAASSQRKDSRARWPTRSDTASRTATASQDESRRTSGSGCTAPTCTTSATTASSSGGEQRGHRGPAHVERRRWHATTRAQLRRRTATGSTTTASRQSRR